MNWAKAAEDGDGGHEAGESVTLEELGLEGEGKAPAMAAGALTLPQEPGARTSIGDQTVPTQPSYRSCWVDGSGGGVQVLAVQQLSVILGVILLVGGGFLLMIGLELGVTWLEKQCTRLLGREEAREEAPAPAALVGSFKRYK